jgi:hypothetical protein
MASRDLVGLLTNTPLNEQPRSFGGSWKEALLQQSASNAQRMNKGARDLSYNLFGVDMRTPQEKMQAELSSLDLNNADDMKKLVGIVSRVDPLRAAQMADRIKAQESAVAQKQELEDKEAADRISFSEYIRNKFPAQPALIQLAESGQLNPSNFKDFLNDPKSSGFLKGTTFTVQDEDQNAFTMVPAFNKDTGKIENTYSPIGTKGPDQPVGKTRVTGGEFALTPEGETARTAGQEGAKAQEKTYGQLRVQAIDSIPTLSASKVDLEKAEMLLNSIETGGPINIAATELEGFFGVKSADKGQLEIILGFNMMESLKPLFGGIISDQEADRLDAIYAGMSKGNPANKGILRQLKKKVDDTIFKSKLYQKTKTVEEFNTLIKQMYPEDAESEKTRVQWSNLQ